MNVDELLSAAWAVKNHSRRERQILRAVKQKNASCAERRPAL